MADEGFFAAASLSLFRNSADSSCFCIVSPGSVHPSGSGRAPATGDLNGFAGAVENITFGFGGPGVIGYIDPNGQFGLGSFAFISVPEPSTFALILAGLLMMLLDRTMASRDSVIVDATFHPDGFTI
jgi:hypothetical protein